MRCAISYRTKHLEVIVNVENIIVMSPEQALEKDYLAEFRRTKVVPQNLFYTAQGAESFYTYRQADLRKICWQDEVDFFAEQPFVTPERPLAFISLGCGNAGAEKMLLRALATSHTVAYFGVDSSRAMLHLAQETLAEETFTRRYVLADFTHEQFRTKLQPHIAPYDVHIYALIGGTFGNFEQHAIADALDQMLRPGEYLYIDVVPKQEGQVDDLRGRFARLPHNLPRFFEGLLEKLGLDPEAGHWVSEEIVENELDTLRYTFFFELEGPVTCRCFGGAMALAPGERIQLMTIRAYDPPALKAFMVERGFVYVDTCLPDVGDLPHLWQRFLFKKV